MGILVVQTEAFLSVGRLCTSGHPVGAWALDGDLFLVANSGSYQIGYFMLSVLADRAVELRRVGRGQGNSRHGDGCFPERA